MNMNNYTTEIAGGSHWSYIARRNTRLTITDSQGGANVGMLFYNPNLLSEKYNAPDTLKCQHTFKLTKGNCLFSDMGRIFCSIIDDDFGWHESICGNTHASHISERWGERNYQDDNNKWHQNGYDSFLVELAKYNLGRQAMASNLNIFSKVSADAHGNLSLTGQAAAGQSITLRFDMDTLVLLHTCPHPFNTSSEYPDKPVQLSVQTGPEMADDDVCLNHRPENRRGFENNALYHLGL